MKYAPLAPRGHSEKINGEAADIRAFTKRQILRQLRRKTLTDNEAERLIAELGLRGD